MLAPATDHEHVYVVDSKDSAVKLGDEVLSVQGKPVAEVLSELELSVSGSTKRMRRFTAARRLSDVLGQSSGGLPLQLKIKRKDQELDVEVLRQAVLTPEPASSSTTSSSAPADTGVDLFKATILPGNIGYLRIDGFSGSQSSFLLGQAMDRLANTRGLVLDVRKKWRRRPVGKCHFSAPREIKNCPLLYQRAPL